MSENELEIDDYGAESIKVLKGLDAVRKRPGMYIGGTDDKAVHHLALEIIDNSMDEAIAGHADLIKISLLEHNPVSYTHLTLPTNREV